MTTAPARLASTARSSTGRSSTGRSSTGRSSTGRSRPRPGDAGERRPRNWLSYLPAWAGAGYLAAWTAGLAAWPSNLALNATSAQVTASYRSHAAPAAAQYLLTEGLAGLLLGIVLAFAVISARRGLTVHARPAAAAGAAAVAISLAQCVIGLFLIAAATHGDVSRAGHLSDLVTRLDGLKMLALAGTAAYLAARRAPAHAMPRWLQVTAAATAVSLAASGYAYLLLANALGWTVYISGTLLLAWVAGTGIWLAVPPDRRSAPAA